MKLSKIKTAGFICFTAIIASASVLCGTLFKYTAVFAERAIKSAEISAYAVGVTADADYEFSAEKDCKLKVASAVDGNGIAVGNDEVIKVVNVTDGSYRLKDGEYSVEDGILLISESYLKTLEQNAEYTFRVVTSSTDFDAVIKTEYTSAEISPAREEFSREEDLSFTIIGGAEVYKVEINGREYAYELEGNTITVSAEALKNLTSGTHIIRVYTSEGRPAVNFSLAALPDYREETVEPVSHVFFWVDIAVFASLIAGYAVFTIVKKYGKKNKGEKE